MCLTDQRRKSVDSQREGRSTAKVDWSANAADRSLFWKINPKNKREAGGPISIFLIPYSMIEIYVIFVKLHIHIYIIFITRIGFGIQKIFNVEVPLLAAQL
jgi:hypothetical protein